MLLGHLQHCISSPSDDIRSQCELGLVLNGSTWARKRRSRIIIFLLPISRRFRVLVSGHIFRLHFRLLFTRQNRDFTHRLHYPNSSSSGRTSPSRAYPAMHLQQPCSPTPTGISSLSCSRGSSTASPRPYGTPSSSMTSSTGRSNGRTQLASTYMIHV